MRTSLVLVGFLGAGVVGAIAGQVLFPPTPPPAQSVPDVARLERRIEQLEIEGETMAAEIRRLSVPAPAPAALGAPETVRGDAVPADVPSPETVAPAAAPSAAGLVPEERIEEKVRETIQEIAEAQRLKKEQWAIAKQAEKEEKWLRDLQRKLLLSDEQVEELSGLLETRRKAQFAFKKAREKLGPDAPPEQVATLEQRMKAFGQRQDQELRVILSTEQYESLMQGRKPAGR